LKKFEQIIKKVRHGDIGKSLKLRWDRYYGRKLNYFHGWRTKQKLLVIESDDWGCEHIRSTESIKMIEQGTANIGTSTFDSLETPRDVQRLCDVLCSVTDQNNNNAIATLNFVMANANFEAVKNNGFSEMKLKTIDQGWNHEPNADFLWSAYRAGINKKLLVPQLHGITHFNTEDGLELLKKGDEQTIKAFDLLMIGEGQEKTGIGLKSMSPIYFGSDKVIERKVEMGLSEFKRIFGVESKTSIAPCYGWSSPQTENAMAKHGVIAMQGREYQHLPNGKTSLHFMGQRKYNIIYMVRNCFFEPFADGTTADECVEQIRWQFDHDFPAVISTHRINYTSRISEKAADTGLKVLSQVLKKIKILYPQVEFCSSETLAMLINKQV
jgi:hypothetical protein